MKASGGTVAIAASMNQPAGVVTGARSPKAPAVLNVSAVMATSTADILIGARVYGTVAACRCSIVNTRDVKARWFQKKAAARGYT